jgi:hypothetical protein
MVNVCSYAGVRQVCPLHGVPIIRIETVKMFGSLGNHTFFGVLHIEMTVI